ncbi:hypothetical protein Lal_00012896 [Lupinus albus]|nr:hypothetical protein Lal_00012896 [Lupinus albus]
MYLLIIFLPVLGSYIVGIFGSFIGSEGTAIMTTTCVSISSILSLIAFYEVASGASACYLRIAPWNSSEMFDASCGFFCDHPDATVAPRRYGLDPLLPTLGYHRMSGRRGDILDVTTPLGAVSPCLSNDNQLSRTITNATGVRAILVREG